MRRCTGRTIPVWLFAPTTSGRFSRLRGDLDGALKYTQRALTIFEKSYGPDNPTTKTVVSNVAAIELAIQSKTNSQK